MTAGWTLGRRVSPSPRRSRRRVDHQLAHSLRATVEPARLEVSGESLAGVLAMDRESGEQVCDLSGVGERVYALTCWIRAGIINGWLGHPP